MKNPKILIVLFLITACNNNQTKNSDATDKALECTFNWFKAWELISKDVFQLKGNEQTWFVFFDTAFVYTTSPITGQGGDIIDGPQLFGEKQVWYKKPHKGALLLPDSSQKKIQMMTYASNTKDKEVKAFFVMPLLSFWENEKIDDRGIGLDKFTTGVFTHEFAHTQQLGSLDKFGKYFEAYIKKHGTDNFGDDMMQNIYEKDSIIISLYNKELAAFTIAGIIEENKRKTATHDALKIFEDKHKLILNRDQRDLKIIDDIWLTMEGIGQYAMYEYLINPKGGNFSKDKAYNAVKTKYWSQEEGFAMFYLLAKYKSPELWTSYFFGSNMKTITEVLKNQAN